MCSSKWDLSFSNLEWLGHYKTLTMPLSKNSYAALHSSGISIETVGDAIEQLDEICTKNQLNIKCAHIVFKLSNIRRKLVAYYVDVTGRNPWQNDTLSDIRDEVCKSINKKIAYIVKKHNIPRAIFKFNRKIT
jgi:hypothetical protein